jgi:uncharacterized protein involved in exopolysaccharide biosynthesis
MIADSQHRTVEADVAEDEYVFSLRPLLGVIWKRLWIIVLVMVLFSGVAVGLSLQQTPPYPRRGLATAGHDHVRSR